jgi:hypothetical protein
MTKKLLAISLFTLTILLTTQCNNNNKKPIETPESDTVSTPVVAEDSTIYGIAIESGMSVLGLCTMQGDTLYVDKEDEEGYGELYGYIEEGDTFAITKRKGEDGFVLEKGYNLSLLNRFDMKYSIFNGELIIGSNDTVKVVSLNDDSIVVSDKSDKNVRAYYARKK